MDVAFSDEQRDLQQMVRDLLSRESGGGAAVWKRLSGVGLTGITVGEEHGGAGASTVELGIVLSELGRALTPVPFLQTAVAATALSGSDAPLAAQVLPAIAAGELVAGLATPGPRPALPAGVRDGADLRLTGPLENVVDGPQLGLLLTPAVVDGDVVLAAVHVDSVAVEPLPTLDRSRPQARIRLDGTPAVQVGGADAASRAVDLLLAAVAVESAGAARYCLDSTVQYVGTRVQFGRPIGSFQALQHRCADLAVLVESATSTAWYAMWAVGADTAAASVDAPLAKAYCADALRRVAGEAIQLHGGIGFTWEHPAHRYLKRAASTQLLFGGRAWVRSLVAQRAGLTP